MINIQFSHALGVYEPGSIVQGKTMIKLHEALKAKCVKVVLEGKAHNKWEVAEKSSDTHSRGSRVPYSATVTYVNEEKTVCTLEDKKLLDVGSHMFEFSFELPENCPPSYEGAFGSIRYSITVIIERAWKTNKTATSFFTVAPVFDLTKVPEAVEPISISRTKCIGVIFFRHGKMTLECQLSKSGYVPGETVPIELMMDNDTSRPITKLEVTLIERSNYVAYRYGAETTRWHGDLNNEETLGYNNRKLDERRMIIIEQEVTVPPHSCESTVIQIPLPPLVPSFKSSSLIHVNHLIQVKVYTKGTINNTARCLCPIIVGTVPIAPGRSIFGIGPFAVGPIRPGRAAATMPNGTPRVGPTPESTFEECAYFSQNNSKSGNGNTTVFVPRFPYYSSPCQKNKDFSAILTSSFDAECTKHPE